jgi:hypothetical protein
VPLGRVPFRGHSVEETARLGSPASLSPFDCPIRPANLAFCVLF